MDPRAAAVDARQEHRLAVERTARYWTLGEREGVTRVWYVLHGYAQLAEEFIGSAAALGGPGRLIVAPEALSRFYIAGSTSGAHAVSAVGASWMTRESRDDEVRDYVRYLDRLHDEVTASLPGSVRVGILGFSQGVATAARWVAAGHITPDPLVLWGAIPPSILPSDGPERFRGLRVVLVRGLRDAVLPGPSAVIARDVLANLGAAVEEMDFPGGHRLDDRVLAALSSR